MSTIAFHRGSEWHKWDLHVHTPKSIVSNYGGDTPEIWEKFLADLESLPKEFKVLGINDYYFLDGYTTVKAYKEAGRLNNIELILPVLELRLAHLAGTEDKLQRINFHVIFSDKIPSDTINSQFLLGLKQHYRLSPTEPDMDWAQSLTRQSLEDLGQKIISSAPSNHQRNYGSPLIEGFNNLAIDLDSIEEKLSSSAFVSDGTPLFLTAVGKTEWDNLKWSDGSIAIKKTLINSVDFVFTAAENIERFKNGQTKLSENLVNSRLLDCSDAHDFSNSSNKDRIGNCFTWLKADPTFEGLRQVRKEMDSRFHIGDTPFKLDDTKADKKYLIKSCSILSSSQDGEWFDEIGTIELNSDLVSIIGNKGSGKSALADIIAIGGNANCTSYSFLSKPKFLALTNVASKYAANLTFQDGIVTSDVALNAPNHKSELPSKVVYLSQSFVRDLCEDENPDRLQAEIDRVILGYIPIEDKQDAGSLSALVGRKTKRLDDKAAQIKEKVQQLNKKIGLAEEFLKDSVVDSLRRRLAEREQQLVLLETAKPPEVLKPVLDESTSKELSLLAETKKLHSSRLTEIQKELNVLTTHLERLESLIEGIGEIGSKRVELVTEYKDDNILKTYSLNVEELVKVTVNTQPVAKQIASIKGKMELLRKERAKIASDDIVLQNKTQSINDKLGTDQKKYQDFILNLSRWEEKKKTLIGASSEKDSIEYYKYRIDYAENKVQNILKGFYDERNALSKAILEQIFEKQQVLNDLYVSVKEHAREVSKQFNIMEEDFIDFNSRLIVDPKFTNEFLRFIHKGRVGTFYGIEEGQKRMQDILSQINLTGVDNILLLPETILNALEQNLQSGSSAKVEIEPQLAQGYTKLEVYNYLFSFDYISPTSEIRYSDKPILALSPGERGALMLIFYLLIDKDTRPIIIDQPEENLDNQTVYERLVKFIKEVKKRRQIIIVTHNPNLAIVCDSEQIIYASIDKKHKNKVSYTSGSIEEPIIRNHVIDILEGTKPAFVKRQDKYELH